MATSDPKISIEISADQTKAVNAFVGLKSSVKETADSFNLAQADAAKLEQAFSESEQQTDALKVQLALGKKELEDLGQKVGKTSVEYNTLNKELKAAETEIKKSAAETKRLEQAHGQAEKKATDLSKRLTEQSLALKGAEHDLRNAGVDVKNLAADYDRLKRSAESAANLKAARVTLDVRPFKEVQAEIQKVKDALETLKASGTASQAEIARATSNADRKIRELKASMEAAAPAASSLGSGFLKAAAGFIAIDRAIAGLKSLVSTATVFDRINSVLEAVSGSSKAAARDFDFVRDVSNRLGLDLASAAGAFAKLEASAKGTSLEGQRTRDIFEAVANALARTGGSVEDTEGALLAIGQMMSKGTVQSEELRGQLGERLPGAFNLAAKAMGVSTAALGKMLENGEVAASEMLPKLAAVLNDTYGSGRIGTLQANLNRLATAWQEFKAGTADTAEIKQGVSALESFVAKARDWMRANSSIGTSVEKLQAQHDALVRMKEYSLFWGRYAGKLVEVNQKLAALTAEEENNRQATDDSARKADEAAKARQDQVKQLDALVNLSKTYTTQVDGENQAREALIKNKLAAAEASAKEAEQAGLHGKALQFEREAIQVAGTLKQAELKRALDLVRAKEGEAKAAQDHADAVTQEAMALGSMTLEVQKAIADARSEASEKRRAADAAKLHADELSRLPVSLAGATSAQALNNAEVRKAYTEAQVALQKAKEMQASQQAGKSTAEQAAAATEVFAVANARLKEATDLAAQSSKAAKNVDDNRVDTLNMLAAALEHETASSRQRSALIDQEKASIENLGSATGGAATAVDQFAGAGQAAISTYGQVTEALEQFRKGASDAMWQELQTNKTFEQDWKTLAKYADEAQRLADVQKQATDAARNLSDAMSSGVGVTDALARATAELSGAVGDLDAQHLDGLRSAIQSAKQQMDGLNESARSTLANLQDELYQLQGNIAASEELQYRQKVAELTQRLNEARKAGNAQAAEDYQRALALENQIHATKMANIQAERDAEERKARTVTTGAGSDQTGTAATSKTVFSAAGAPQTPQTAQATTATPKETTKTVRLEFVAPDRSMVAAGDFAESEAAKMLSVIRQSGMRVAR